VIEPKTPPIDDIDSYYRSLENYWHPVLLSAQLTSEAPVRISLLGRDLVLARLGAQLSAMRDLCRHFQARLSDGTLEEFIDPSGERHSVVRCRYHGWAYRHDGQCIHIPQLGGDKSPAKSARVEVFEIAEMHGLIWVCLGSPVSDIPRFPECEEIGMVGTPINQSPAWKCSLPRLILSALDDYHFPWLHDGLLGSRDDALPPERNIFREGSDLISDFQVNQPPNVTNSKSINVSSVSVVSYRMQIHMPNVMRLIKRSNAGIYVVFFFPYPISFNETGLFYRVVRNYAVSNHDDTRILAFEAMVQSMDAPVVSNQRPWLQTPYTIKGADDALVEYRKWCSELSIPLSV
jgi:phenylpropionate dioxygenase-like ring-hydroxylating dioxygenase large terminal subunit